jgi:hypothetical protein
MRGTGVGVHIRQGAPDCKSGDSGRSIPNFLAPVETACLYKRITGEHSITMKRRDIHRSIPLILALLFLAGGASAQVRQAPGDLSPKPPPGIIQFPPSTIPQRPGPEVYKPAPAPVPAVPSRPEYRGAVNPRTGQFYPSQGHGVFNPRTGEFYPRSGSGYINPRTGEFYPGIERGGVPESSAPTRP